MLKLTARHPAETRMGCHNPSFGCWLKEGRNVLHVVEEARSSSVGGAAETIRTFNAARRHPVYELTEQHCHMSGHVVQPV